MSNNLANTPKFFFEPAQRSLKSEFHLLGFSGVEGLSQMMRFHLQLKAKDPDVEFAQLLDQPAALIIATGDDETPEHKYHGMVARVEQAGRGVEAVEYLVELVPRLWRLTLNHRSRIFQNQSAPDIVEKILQEHLQPDDYKFSLQRQYPVREYCAQYRESDFAFISRLLEEEGIFYFFEHTDRKEVLVIADAASAHPQTAPLKELAFSQPSGLTPRETQTIFSLKYAESIVPNQFTLKDYNELAPQTNLMASSRLNGNGAFVQSDYPGGFRFLNQGSDLARIRNEEAEAGRARLTGASDCRSFYAGHRFKLSGHFRNALNEEYVLVSVSHSGTQNAAGEQIADGRYNNHFECLPLSQPFRPPRYTPKPHIAGAQTAVVVGPSNEKLYMDEHGRAKVQFHWDLEGRKNEESSCWVRVSHGYAGQNHGIQFHPLVGDEVVVEFLEGNPDRPLITGCVYNGNNRPPLNPEKRIQNVILTPYHHQLLFDDQAKSLTLNTGGKETIFMADGKDSDELGNHLKISTADGHTILLAKGGNLKGLQIQTEAGHTVLLQDEPSPGILVQDKEKKLSISFDSDNEIIEIKNTGSAQIDIKCENGTVNVSATEINVNASQKIALRAESELSLSAPEIKIEGDAKIQASAPEMQLEGANKLAAKGMQVALEGSAQLEAKGAMVKVQGSGITDIKGGLVKIN